MSAISSETAALLRRFAVAKDRTLSVDTLHQLLPGREYKDRIDALRKENVLAVADSRSYADGDLYVVGRPSAYRLTAYGADLLSAFEKDQQERADREAEAKRKEADQRTQAQIDKKQKFRHDFKVAAFSVALTAAIAFFIQHFSKLLHCLQRVLPSIRKLLGF